MKLKLKFLLAAGLAWPAVGWAQAASYTITNTPGWNLIAVQLTNSSGNNIRNVIPTAPVGSVLRKFNLSTHSFEPLETYTANGWIPGNTMLRPGEGACFSNALKTAVFNMTITGNGVVPALPVNNGNGSVLRARQTNALASFNNIMGYSPTTRCAVYRLNGADRDPFTLAGPNYVIHIWTGTAWSPALPAIRVGESVWVGTNGAPPTISQPPADQEVCAGDTATFSVSATQPLPMPLSYQWRFGATPLAGETQSTLTLLNVSSADEGSYSVVVGNPFGAVTSSIAKLVLQTPTTASGPTNIVSCLGSGVTLTTTPHGAGPYTYTWFYNGKQIPNASGNSIPVGPLGATNIGTYCVIVSGLCNSVTNCAQVSIGDLVLPYVYCPKSFSVSCTGVNGTRVTYDATVSDDCDPNPTLTCTPPSGSLFSLGTTRVVCTGKDASGNTNACSFNVTVNDVPPTISCPNDITVTSPTPAGVPVNFVVTASDLCSTNVTVQCAPASGTVFPVGTNLVYCVATDPSTNADICSFNIVVLPPPCCERKEWVLLNPKDPPNPRSGHAMANHAGREMVVLFGGRDVVGIRGDTYVYWAGEWLSSGSGGPAAREYAAMAYDENRKKVVLFGGNGTDGALSDTWEWDDGWQRIEVSGPSARYAHSMAYDSVRKRVVLYGGWIPAVSQPSDETWEYDGTKWELIAAAKEPGQRAAHAMAWDGTRITLFGGYNTNGILGDTWRYLGGEWKLAATNGPSPRRFHAMAYDEGCNRVVLFGGGSTLALTATDDTWEWNGAGWSDRSVTGPSPRWKHAMAYESASQQVILFGGYHDAVVGGGPLGDTWGRRDDQTPPRVLSISALCGDNQIVITFSEPVDPVSASNPANYNLDCGSATITGVVVEQDGQTVYVQISKPMTGTCSIEIIEVRDLCGNIITKVGREFTCTPDPCPNGSTGREFWLTFPGNYSGGPTNLARPRLFISGDAGTSGTVSAPGLSPPYLANFTIPADGVAVLTLPQQAELGDANEVVQPKGVHVVANRKVSVYGLNHLRCTSDAFLGLSTESLGRSYLVLTYQNVFMAIPELNAVQFAVVGTVDNTTVQIVPSTGILSHPAQVPFTVTLNRGETYQLRNTNDTPADLSGTVVAADQPIGVFGSHRCANIPNTNVFFCDYLVEQMLPTDMWGNNFVAMPLATRAIGDTFRIMALFTNTTVTIDGWTLPYPLHRGQFFEGNYPAPQPVHITADKPLLVAQYANSSDFGGPTDSDPFMVLIPPTQRNASSYVVQCPASGFTDHFINVTAPTAEVGHISLDGAAIAFGWVPIPGSGYSGVQLPVTSGAHTLTSSTRVPFGVVVYGWAEYDSYGYPGAACSARGVQPPTFTCPRNNISVNVDANCVAEVPDLTKEVGNADQAVMILQEPPAGTLLGPGTYTITVTIIDQLGARHLCNTIFTVQPGSGAGLRCPSNITTNCLTAQGTVVSYEPALCNTNFVVTCVPPSGTLFPIGSTLVSCVAEGTSEKCTFTVTVRCSELNVSVSGNRLTVTWSEPGQLQRADRIGGTWVTIPGAPNPYVITVTPETRQAFFRVVQ